MGGGWVDVRMLATVSPKDQANRPTDQVHSIVLGYGIEASPYVLGNV